MFPILPNSCSTFIKSRSAHLIVSNLYIKGSSLEIILQSYVFYKQRALPQMWQRSLSSSLLIDLWGQVGFWFLSHLFSPLPSELSVRRPPRSTILTSLTIIRDPMSSYEVLGPSMTNILLCFPFLNLFFLPLLLSSPKSQPSIPN